MNSPLLRRSRTRAATTLLCVATLLPSARATPDADYAERVWASVNAYRSSQGLEPLLPSPALTALAAEHSAAMASQRRPSHDGFAGRFERAGESSLCVENVAQGFRNPEQVILGWRKVSTHHRNLLETRVRYAGIVSDGLFVTYFACDLTGAER